MTKANELLDFNFSTTTLKQAAANIFSLHVTKSFDVQINKLQKIVEHLEESERKSSLGKENLIPDLFRRYKTLYADDILTSDKFEKGELRTLTYSLSYSEKNKKSIFSSAEELISVFNILEESGWRGAYINGLVDCYLRNWQSEYIVSLEQLSKYIFEKLKQYSGDRTVLKSFKSNSKFFHISNGDTLLGSELALKNKQIKEATKYLSVPDSWFSYPYFANVILAYYDKRKKDIGQFIDDLHLALKEHTNPVSSNRINRIVVCKLIVQANTLLFANLQDKVKNVAFEFIGDPGIVSNWFPFDKASDSEKQEIINARNILNEWLTKEFINVFFEQCIKDERRKKFWLKYAKEVKRVRVVGSTYIKQLLQNRIKQDVSPRFCKTGSSSDTNSALMFILKEYLFIEFSDSGAFYAYKLSNPKAPSIDAPYFHATSQLKITTMSQLVYRKGVEVNQINEEGRLGHGDGEVKWEDVAEYWIKEKLGIKVK